VCKFFLALVEEKIRKSLAGYPVSGLTGYPAGYPADQFGIRPDTGYQKRPDYPAVYPASRISGASLVFSTEISSFSCPWIRIWIPNTDPDPQSH
jgi:hypothetical protein